MTVTVAFDDFVFDSVQRTLSKDGTPLKVDAKLLQLLGCFLAHPNRLLTKRELLDLVWDGRPVAENVLSVSVAKLRKILGQTPGGSDYIENSYGRGYKFVRPPLLATEDSDPLADAPLVGRSASLHRLEAALARAQMGGGSICAIVGEAGIGKTRLATVLEQHARARHVRTAWGRCQATEGTAPLWPFAQVLRELSGSAVADEIVRVQRDQATPEISAMLSDAGLYDAVRTSHGTIDAVTRALYTASKEQPLLILLEDLQWADAASLRLLGYLAGEISRWPILVVATQRSSEVLPDDRSELDLRLLTHRSCERIEIARLQESDIEAYVSAVFGDHTADLSHAVFTRSEGNPFFMVELLRRWVGLGQPAPEQLEMPAPALDLVRARLSRLPPDARKVLAAAAVLGHDFELSLLHHVTEQDAHVLLAALDSTFASDTVSPTSELFGTYKFDHELVRELLYNDLPRLERGRLHLRALDGLERRRATGGDVAGAELAHHALAALPQGDVSIAIGYAREAAGAAICLGAHIDARALLRRALAAQSFRVAPDPETQTALLFELAIATRIVADERYRAYLAQGVALARELGLGRLLLMAGQFLSPGPGNLADADACSVLEAAAEVLPPDDDARRAAVLAHLAWTPPYCHSAARVNAQLSEAERLARRSNDLNALATVRDARLFFSAGPSTLPLAERVADEIDRDRALRPTLAGQWRATSTATFRLITALQRGDAPGVERAIEQLEAVHRKLKNTELAWHHDRMLLCQQMNRGEWDGVEGELTRLRERAIRLRLHSCRAICRYDYGAFLLKTGEARTFAEHLRPSLQMLDTDIPFARALKLRNMAEWGFLADARAALAQISLESLHDLPQDRDYLAVLGDLAVASIITRSIAHCETLYELLLPYPEYYAASISFYCDGSISHYLGRLARVLGRDDRALAHLTLGVERNRAFGLQACAAQSLFDLAMLLRESHVVRDLPRAQTLLRETAETAGRLGMRALQRAAAAHRNV